MKIISREPKIRKHIDPIVVEYLKKIDVLEIYESYLLSRIKKIIEIHSPETLFQYPFTIMSISWVDAIEGSDFWYNIHAVTSKIDNSKKIEYIKVSQLEEVYENSKKKN